MAAIYGMNVSGRRESKCRGGSEGSKQEHMPVVMNSKKFHCVYVCVYVYQVLCEV